MAAKKKLDYIEILISRGVISPEQLAEAEEMSQHADMRLPDALTRLGYATGEEIMRAMAEEHGLDYVKLSDVKVPPPSWSSFPNRLPARTSSCRWPRRTGP